MFMVTYLDIAKLEQAAIKIYPNPANHTLTIQQFKSLPNTTYTIYNAYGQFVKSGNLDGMETKIDVDTLSFGLYILRIADSESNFSYTFLKQAE
jgi:hypothetical protein